MEKIKNLLSKINWTDKRLIAIVLVVLLILLMMGFNNRLVNMNRLIRQENTRPSTSGERLNVS